MKVLVPILLLASGVVTDESGGEDGSGDGSNVTGQIPVKMIFKSKPRSVFMSEPRIHGRTVKDSDSSYHILGQKLEPYVLAFVDADGNQVTNIGNDPEVINQPWLINVHFKDRKTTEEYGTDDEWEGGDRNLDESESESGSESENGWQTGSEDSGSNNETGSDEDSSEPIETSTTTTTTAAPTTTAINDDDGDGSEDGSDNGSDDGSDDGSEDGSDGDSGEPIITSTTKTTTTAAPTTTAINDDESGSEDGSDDGSDNGSDNGSDDGSDDGCDEGYEFSGDDCADIDECYVDAQGVLHDCDAQAVCENHKGGYTCTCNAGYFGDGVECLDHDECGDTPITHTTNGISDDQWGQNDCDTNAQCLNVQGGFNCTCNDGFEGDGINCLDLDECELGHECDGNSTCYNYPGGYNCTCHDGYFVESDDVGCEDLNECREQLHDCDINAECTNLPGNYNCTCADGYSGDGFTCEENDECEELTAEQRADLNCHNDAVCKKFPEGVFNCSCMTGFFGDGFECFDNDECAEKPITTIAGIDDPNYGVNSCHEDAACTNMVGNYKCTCNDGYTDPTIHDNGFECTDINECLFDGMHNCHADAICTNTEGSWNCTCNDGFAGDGLLFGFGEGCTDVDECDESIHNCDENAFCNDWPGSYNCTCIDGFEGDGFECTDIDECELDFHDCHADATCFNTHGFWNCTCNDGFSGDGLECEGTEKDFGSGSGSEDGSGSENGTGSEESETSGTLDERQPTPTPSVSRKRRAGSRVRAAEGFVEQVDVDYYTGTATFDNLEFFGDLAATKLEFTVLIPPDWETAEKFTLETDEILFAPPITLEAQWEIDECIEAGDGYAFSFNQGCEMVCSAPCVGSTGATCDKVTSCSSETYGICDVDNNGVHTCVCDMDSVPSVNSLNAQESFEINHVLTSTRNLL